MEAAMEQQELNLQVGQDRVAIEGSGTAKKRGQDERDRAKEGSEFSKQIDSFSFRRLGHRKRPPFAISRKSPLQEFANWK